MSTLSLRPSLAAQLSALASTVVDFVREVKAAPAAPAASGTEVWALYRMNRGADAVAPAVARRLAAHARAR